MISDEMRHNFYLDGNPASSSEMKNFNWLVLLAQVLGIASVTLTAVWMGHYRGGFAWTEDPAHEFNYHPLFMVIGLIFLYADGILTYRVFRNDKKIYIKLLHAFLHVAALIFASVGLKAVFDSHNLPAKPIPNMYSLHSWLGLFVVVAFGLQWLLGFTAFLLPGWGMALRTAYMPHHRFWGVALLIMATMAALTGITEKAFIHALAVKDLAYSALPAEGLVINFLGLSLVAFTGLVVYLATKPEYKRQPAPDEGHEPLGD